MNIRNFQVALLVAVALCLPACAGEQAACPLLPHEQQVLQQGQYELEHGVSPDAMAPGAEGMPIRIMRVWPGSPNLLAVPKSKSSTVSRYGASRPSQIITDAGEPTDSDYLTAPLLGIDAIRGAQLYADKLQKDGQYGLAKVVHERIADALLRLYGSKASEKKVECLALAEQLSTTAWKLQQKRLYLMAEKLFGNAVDVYQQELGNNPRTAAALGDLALIYADEEKNELAKTTFERAISIYDSLGVKDADLATILEQYADLMDRTAHPQLAMHAYARAGEVRKAAYAGSRKG